MSTEEKADKKEQALNVKDSKWAASPSFKPDKTETWGGQSLESDGWVDSHNQIRNELGSLVKASRALAGREKVKKKHLELFLKFWAYEKAVIHRHHQLEEKLWYPTYEKRIKFPQSTMGSHKDLEDMLPPLSKMFEELSKMVEEKKEIEEFDGIQANLKAITASLDKLESFLLPHFKEEEQSIPLVRAFFTKDEVGAMAQSQAKIVPIPDPHHTGGFFGTMYIMGGEAKVREFMSMAGIPSFVFGMKFKGAIVAYHNELWIPLQEVIENKDLPRMDNSGCVIL